MYWHGLQIFIIYYSKVTWLTRDSGLVLERVGKPWQTLSMAPLGALGWLDPIPSTQESTGVSKWGGGCSCPCPFALSSSAEMWWGLGPIPPHSVLHRQRLTTPDPPPLLTCCNWEWWPSGDSKCIYHLFPQYCSSTLLIIFVILCYFSHFYTTLLQRAHIPTLTYAFRHT